MRVLVTGGRDYDDLASVVRALDELRAKYGPLTVIQGGATGADYIARYWCSGQSSVRLINEPADWKRLGKAAGPIRNQRMIDEHKPDLVLAFEGGRGTADMISRAEAAGIPVQRVPRSRPGPPLMLHEAEARRMGASEEQIEAAKTAEQPVLAAWAHVPYTSWRIIRPIPRSGASSPRRQ